MSSAQRPCEKGLAWEHATYTFDNLGQLHVDATETSHSAVAAALEKGQQWEAASSVLQVLRCTRHRGLRLSDFVFNSVLGCDRTPWQVAMNVLDVLQQQQIPRSEITLGAAIQACEASLAWLNALSLLPAAAGSIIACNAALSALAQGLQPQLALQLLQELPVERWSVVTLNTLMPWMPWAVPGEMEWDPELWQRRLGIRPNLMSYNEATLLSERCEDWFQLVRRLGVLRREVLGAVKKDLQFGRRMVGR
eukprot:s2710_g11.t1